MSGYPLRSYIFACELLLLYKEGALIAGFSRLLLLNGKSQNERRKEWLWEKEERATGVLNSQAPIKYYKAESHDALLKRVERVRRSMEPNWET